MTEVPVSALEVHATEESIQQAIDSWHKYAAAKAPTLKNPNSQVLTLRHYVAWELSGLNQVAGTISSEFALEGAVKPEDKISLEELIRSRQRDTQDPVRLLLAELEKRHIQSVGLILHVTLDGKLHSESVDIFLFQNGQNFAFTVEHLPKSVALPSRSRRFGIARNLKKRLPESHLFAQNTIRPSSLQETSALTNAFSQGAHELAKIAGAN